MPNRPSSDELVRARAHVADLPNLEAILIGCIAGPHTDWPLVRIELLRLLGRLEAAARLHETDVATHLAFVERYSDGLTIQQWATERDHLLAQLAAATATGAECPRLAAQVEALTKERVRELEATPIDRFTGHGNLECGHSSYWQTAYKTCMACRAEKAEAETARLRAQMAEGEKKS